MRFFEGKADIFQIRDNQVLLISTQKKQLSAELFAENITLFFNHFIKVHKLPAGVSIGIVAFPFLNNVSRAITPTRMLNLSSLALFGASQIRDHHNENSWLELYAIDNLQPAFLMETSGCLVKKPLRKVLSK
ncbi:hypothetical protein ACLKMH_20555 [Psychromonas sp. KJ10-10]|uniref:hypothetical protein n=1 Tax=Psychromonas sp. KJ10-10 TaxID=3391823 RepID=UPI0039B67EC5